MTKVDYMVVGQGLAGTLICHFLEKRNRSFVVFDAGHPGTSSSIAAGIINPVTGRRFVKAWMYDELLKTALKTYNDLERRLGIPLVRQRNIIRQLPDIKSENEWLSKIASEAYSRYMVPRRPHLQELTAFVDLSGRWCEVTGSYQIDIQSLISSYREILNKNFSLVSQQFDNQLLVAKSSGLIYGDVQSEYIIFCEGQKVHSNPFFKTDFLNPSKGEILLLEIPGFRPRKNIKKKFFLVPWMKDVFWFGAKDGWQFENDHPSKEGFQILSKHAEDMIRGEFKILDHLAAIRPTVKDRRPVIGRNTKHERMFLFNGFGTKGASLGPYWAEKLLEYIEDKRPLPVSVQYQRFIAAD